MSWWQGAILLVIGWLLAARVDEDFQYKLIGSFTFNAACLAMVIMALVKGNLINLRMKKGPPASGPHQI